MSSNKKIDVILLITIIMIVIFGLFMVYSASNVVALYKYNDAFYYIKRQIIFSVIGIVLMLIIARINIKYIYKYTTHIFITSIVLLILVLIPGIGSVRGGARSWIGVGVFSIQPAEVVKLTIILLLSKYVSKYYEDLKKVKNFFLVIVVIGLIFALIMLQPDFGTGLVIVISSIILLFAAATKIKYFMIILITGIVGVIGLIISAPYRLERITAFINPWQDPLGSGFQGIQSLFAITPSGIFGLGYNQSIQKHFFLPEPQNDFIFAIIIEELGLIGGALLLIGYFIICIRAIRISARVNNLYLSFLALGIGISQFVQVFINVAVVIGLLPITGITLPIISYGGSSLVMTLMLLGILLNISKHEEW